MVTIAANAGTVPPAIKRKQSSKTPCGVIQRARTKPSIQVQLEKWVGQSPPTIPMDVKTKKGKGSSLPNLVGKGSNRPNLANLQSKFQ